MPNLGELAHSLGAVELDPSSLPATVASHLLQLEWYPSLLPADAVPHLEPPALLQIRDQPPRNPEAVGIYDDTFYTRLPLQPSNPFALMPCLTKADGLITAIECASMQPGNSILRFIGFRTDEQVAYKLSLDTKSTDTTKLTQIFELDETEIDRLLSLQHSAAWIRLLNSLKRRVRARTYYHVRSRLIKTYGKEVANLEEGSWGDSWSSQPPRSVRQILWSRLFPQALGIKSLELMMSGPDGMLAAQPPCGDHLLIRKAQLKALAPEACLTFTYGTCGKHVLQPCDEHELAFRELRRKARVFTEAQAA